MALKKGVDTKAEVYRSRSFVALNILGVSETTLGRDVERGIVPSSERGKGVPCFAGWRLTYEAYLRERDRSEAREKAAQAAVDEDDIDEFRERARKVKLEADALHLKNEEKKGNLISVEAMREEQIKFATTFARGMDALPAKIFQRLPKLTTADREIIIDELTNLRNSL